MMFWSSSAMFMNVFLILYRRHSARLTHIFKTSSECTLNNGLIMLFLSFRFRCCRCRGLALAMMSSFSPFSRLLSMNPFTLQVKKERKKAFLQLGPASMRESGSGCNTVWHTNNFRFFCMHRSWLSRTSKPHRCALLAGRLHIFWPPSSCLCKGLKIFILLHERDSSLE